LFYDFFFWLPGVREYHMSVRRSPGIPFDAKKKPGQGVLKPCPVGSRVNPFYELNKKKCNIQYLWMCNDIVSVHLDQWSCEK